MPTHRSVVVASGLPELARRMRGEYGDPDLTLDWQGPRRNVVMHLAEITAALGCTVPPVLADLLEIAVAIYAADIAFLRGANEAWVRSVRMLIPVRELELWRTLEPQLAEALYVLSHDNYMFDFCERNEAASVYASCPAQKRFAGAECVALLSGGLDSLAGAVMLLTTGRVPLFIAHRPYNPAIVASQQHVYRCLREAFDRPFYFVPIRMGPARGGNPAYPYPPPEQRETSQRTRSFLYLTLGALGCYAVGAGQIFCPENGVLAVNLPLTSARVGGYSTAGARPQTLRRFGALLEALGFSVTVENPLLYQTKGQLVRDILRRYLSPDAIQGTVSCWMAGRYSRACGSCIPCLLRAIAMRTAGLPPEAHMLEPFAAGDTLSPETAGRANLVDLLTFVERLRRMSDFELLRAYPVLLELASEADIAAIIQMLRRFGDEAVAALGGDSAMS